ncbi:MAG: sigma-70 family RNA polymerase sigma factor [Alphaproteobacteria bacterium]
MVIVHDIAEFRSCTCSPKSQKPAVLRGFFEVFRERTRRLIIDRLGIGQLILPAQEDLTVPDTRPALTLHVAALRRYANALEGNREEADDLVQECLARAIARTRVWSEIRNVRAYLFTILHNLHIDRISRGRTAGMAVPLDHVEHKLTTKPAQEEGLRIRDLERALRVLPDDYRKAVLLVGLEGMSYQEAATTLGIPIGTVMSRLSRGRETLRQLMATDAHGKLRMVR